jgi:hypothetical protein
MTGDQHHALVGALDRYFSTFDSTRELASELIGNRKHPVEVLLLLCARVDALASDSSAEEASNKKTFASFVSAYGRKRDFFDSVSIGDLYYELSFHRWLLEGMIPKPGHVHRFSRIDTPFIRFLEAADVPLTVDDCTRLIDTIIRILKREFRLAPRGPLSRPRIAKASALKRAIVDGARRSRLKTISQNLPAALDPMLESKRIGVLLYERFRCESIHGATVKLDEGRFFSESDVYWTALRSEYYGPFELIEFPGQFLLSLLESCIQTYRAHLLARGKLPPPILFHAFPEDVLERLDLLDESLLAEGGRVRLDVGR